MKTFTMAVVRTRDRITGRPAVYNHDVQKQLRKPVRQIIVAYIPPHAKWYLADLVVQIRVEDDPRILVHVNTVLVRADSPEQAYDEAMQLGREHEQEYENSENKLVRATFRGLRDLNVIHDELEHGAELAYSQETVHSEEEAPAFVRNQRDLAVFTERRPSCGPNYAAKWVVDKLREAGAEGLEDSQ